MFERQEVQQLRNIYRRRWPRKRSKIKLLKTSRKTDTLGDNLRQKLVFPKLISTSPGENEQFFGKNYFPHFKRRTVGWLVFSKRTKEQENSEIRPKACSHQSNHLFV